MLTKPIFVVPYSSCNWAMTKRVGPGVHYGIYDSLKFLGKNAYFLSGLLIPDLADIIPPNGAEQLWIDAIHSKGYGPSLERIADIRVGLFIESESQKHPYDELIKQFTHSLMLDPQDVDKYASRGYNVMQWYPTVTARPAVGQVFCRPEFPDKVAFYGTLYDDRPEAIRRNSKISHITYEPDDRVYSKSFDNLASKFMRDKPKNLESAIEFSAGEMLVRVMSYQESIVTIQRYAASVNLATRCKFFPDRVYRALALKRPVISAAYVNPEVMKFFGNNGGVLYYRDFEGLRNIIDRITSDSAFCEIQGELGYQSIAEKYDLDILVTKALEWIRATK